MPLCEFKISLKEPTATQSSLSPRQIAYQQLCTDGKWGKWWRTRYKVKVSNFKACRPIMNTPLKTVSTNMKYC